MAKARSDMQQYALVGAQARLDTLGAEVATLLRTFPELRGARAIAGDTSDHASASAPGRKRASRRTMTAAQRKAVGERMTKYWVRRRKEKAGKGAVAKAKIAKTAKAGKTVAPAA